MGSAQAELACIGWDILMYVAAFRSQLSSLFSRFLAVSDTVKCNQMTNQHRCCWFQVAIIIPFRHRENHLKYWLHYLHPILRRQKIDYGIYIINQVCQALVHAVSCVALAKVTLKRGGALLIGVVMANKHLNSATTAFPGGRTNTNCVSIHRKVKFNDVRHVQLAFDGQHLQTVRVNMIEGWLTSGHSLRPEKNQLAQWLNQQNDILNVLMNSLYSLV